MSSALRLLGPQCPSCTCRVVCTSLAQVLQKPELGSNTWASSPKEQERGDRDVSREGGEAKLANQSPVEHRAQSTEQPQAWGGCGAEVV